MHLLKQNSTDVVFLVCPCCLLLGRHYGSARYCFTSEAFACWCSYLSSLPATAFLSGHWTIEYFQTQGCRRQAAAHPCCYTDWAFTLTLLVGLPTRVWWVCNTPPAYLGKPVLPREVHVAVLIFHLLGLARKHKACLFGNASGATEWQSCSRHWCLFVMLGHGCDAWQWVEVWGCVAVTGGLHRAVLCALGFFVYLFHSICFSKSLCTVQ